MNWQNIEHTELETFKQMHPELIVEDNIDLALAELFDIDRPERKDTKTPDEVAEFGMSLTGGSPTTWGVWAYYPWLNKLVHFPPVEKLRALRTSRNRNLINTAEQARLYEATVLVIGMSVGSNIVEALVSHGIGGKLVLVDMDIIEPSNLNRIRSPYHHIGLHKVDAISRKVWEIDPFIEIVQVKEGLNGHNLKSILDEQGIDVIVDEMDDLRMKIVLREEAKSRGLPVVMAADDGDNSLLDIERYDLDPELQLFSGLIPDEVLSRIKDGELSRPEIGMTIGKYFVGADNIPLRMFESLGEVGKTLPSWPQLGGAATLSGVVVAFAVRKIILDQQLKPGRTLVAIDSELDPELNDEAYKQKLEHYKQFLNG